MTDVNASPTPALPGLWEDFVDIFYQPSAVFERRRDGQFGLALLVLAVVTGILAFALHNGLAPVMDAVMAKQQAAALAKNPGMDPEQFASMSGLMETMSKYGAIIFVPIAALLGGVLIWLAGKLLDAKVIFAAAMMISTYAGIPRVV